MRPLNRNAGAELSRATLRDIEAIGGTAEVEALTSRSWASITFSGERHQLRLRLGGAGAETAAERFAAGIGEREFDLRGHILADIAVVAKEQDPLGQVVRLQVEALTVEAS